MSLGARRRLNNILTSLQCVRSVGVMARAAGLQLLEWDTAVEVVWKV
jgi:hypothetical protein